MVKLLFVCAGNVGRSQMAEAYYNYFTKTKNAFSAGIDPGMKQKYPSLPKELIELMKEENIDISKQKPKLLTKEMVEDYDKIYIFEDKEEYPDYLLNSNKITIWKVKDPYTMSKDGRRVIRDVIKKKILLIIF